MTLELEQAHVLGYSSVEEMRDAAQRDALSKQWYASAIAFQSSAEAAQRRVSMGAAQNDWVMPDGPLLR